MPKAGLFAGEVTPQAPADGAATLKQKGYQWMEYGAAPQPFTPSTSTGGIASTQSNYHVNDPDLEHPFAGESYDEFTMSMVCKLTTGPSVGEDSWSHAFNLREFGEGTYLSAIRSQSTGKILLYHRLSTYASTGWVSEGGIDITGTVGDWYWVAMSYDKATDTRDFHAVNLDTGSELSGTSTKQNSESITWLSPSDGSAESVCNWGFRDWNFLITVATWKGYLSQILIHNKYIDLSVSANRRLFCSLDGAIDYGMTGEIPFGERPLVYLTNGHPSSNVGTKFIGNWDEDFWINPSFVVDEDLPPIGTP